MPSERQSNQQTVEKSLKDKIKQQKEAINQIEAKYERVGNRNRSMAKGGQRENQLSNISVQNSDEIGVIGSQISKGQKSNQHKRQQNKQQRQFQSSNKRVQGGSVSTQNSGFKMHNQQRRNQIERKLSNGDDINENFKNSQMRFTNNNFIFQNQTAQNQQRSWIEQSDKKEPLDEEINLEESIEEEIVVGNESPLINSKNKAKAQNLMPPIYPKIELKSTKEQNFVQ